MGSRNQKSRKDRKIGNILVRLARIRESNSSKLIHGGEVVVIRDRIRRAGKRKGGIPATQRGAARGRRNEEK